jgi:hypothetical protein
MDHNLKTPIHIDGHFTSPLRELTNKQQRIFIFGTIITGIILGYKLSNKSVTASIIGGSLGWFIGVTITSKSGDILTM